MRRMERVGLLEQKICPIFGYYPWECSGCRKRVLMKDRGEKEHSGHHVRPSSSRPVTH